MTVFAIHSDQLSAPQHMPEQSPNLITETVLTQVALRRPHYQLRGGDLYFLISSRPSRKLNTQEIEVWEALKEPTLVADLVSINSEYLQVIADFHNSEYIELAESTFPENRKKILVIEPHADDAALSVGGAMWNMRNDCEFTLLTVASRSNFTSYYNLYRDYFNISEVSALRRAESALFCRMLGAKHAELDLTDAVLRYRDKQWDIPFFKAHRMSIAVATSRVAPSQERKNWQKKLQENIDKNNFDEIWFPLGSPHGDHALTTRSIFKILSDNTTYLDNKTLRIYQDVPYGARFPDFTSRALAAISKAGYKVQSEKIDIEKAFKDKLRLISIYASQFKLKALLEDIKANAYTLPDNTTATEQFWLLSGHNSAYPTGDLFEYEETANQEVTKTAQWAKKWNKSKIIRIVMLNPPGQWTHDLSTLSQLFPHAKFEIYISEPSRAEIFANSMDRVIPRVIQGGTINWILICFKLIAARPAPTLFLAGNKVKSASILAKLWLFSDSNIASSLDVVTTVFEQHEKSTLHKTI